MMKHKLAYFISSAAVLGSAGLFPAFAADVTVAGNGAFSDNNVRIAQRNNDITVRQRNDTNIVNTVRNYNDTGHNRANFNTWGDTSIRTGDAESNVWIQNKAGSNYANVNGCGDCDRNKYIRISGNGAYSENTVRFSDNDKNNYWQDNNSRYDNKVKDYNKSGYNRSDSYDNNYKKYDSYNKDDHKDYGKYDNGYYQKKVDYKDHDYDRKEYNKDYDHNDYYKSVKYGDDHYKGDYSYTSDDHNKYNDHDKKYAKHDYNKHDEYTKTYVNVYPSYNFDKFGSMKYYNKYSNAKNHDKYTYKYSANDDCHYFTQKFYSPKYKSNASGYKSVHSGNAYNNAWLANAAGYNYRY